jgi:hypothetical protein
VRGDCPFFYVAGSAPWQQQPANYNSVQALYGLQSANAAQLQYGQGETKTKTITGNDLFTLLNTVST